MMPFGLTACTFENFVQVNIPIFVTGGIGGVHRHGEQSMLTSYILLIKKILVFHDGC